MRDYKQLNGLALAYVGDAIYEIYIRDYLVSLGQTKPNVLHRMATHYVSAKAQASLMQAMLAGEMLTEEEEVMYKRGRNAKSHTFAKNADVTTYRVDRFRILDGLFTFNTTKRTFRRINNWCIKKVGETSEK